MPIGPILRAMKHNRTRVVLIILEIAMTLAIVTNCVNVILAERAKMQRKSGFDDENILWLRVRPFTPEFREAPFVDTVIDADVRTISAIPGVRSVANTNFRVWEGGGSSTYLKEVAKPGEGHRTQIYYATKDIAQTLDVRISEGRGFRAGDHGVGTETDPANVGLISKALASQVFPDGRAVGKPLQLTSATGEPTGEPITVIGVMEQFYNPYGMPGGEFQSIEDRAIFLPARVGSYNSGIRYLIRTEPGAMESVIPEIEKRLAAANAGRVFEFLRTNEKKARYFSASSVVVTTLTTIIIVLVFVTALGLLGLTALAVAERTKQIGTRRALGATRSDILKYFLVENLLITTAGLALGVIGAYALNIFLVNNLADVKLPWELLVAGIVLLWMNGILATIPPAMRAMMVSPAVATRSV